MSGEDGIDREAVEQAVLHHRQRASAAFLGGLEDQHHGTVELSVQGEVPRGGQQHGGVPVVPTSVHAALVATGVREAVVFLQRQRVHVGTQSDGSLALASANDTHDPSAADPADDGYPPTLQQPGDPRSRALLREAKFRMRVQIAPDRDELRQMGFDVGDHRSASSKPATTFATLAPSTSSA